MKEQVHLQSSSKVPLESVESLPLASWNLDRVHMDHIIIPLFTVWVKAVAIVISKRAGRDCCYCKEECKYLLQLKAYFHWSWLEREAEQYSEVNEDFIVNCSA